MSSVGQGVGMVIGGVLGVMFPVVGFALGAAIGGAIGGWIDPPKGPNSVGPRMSDKSIQTSSYGVCNPRITGTLKVTGNVVWVEGDQYKEHEKKTKSGGKGGGSSGAQTTFWYSATFAAKLAWRPDGPVSGVRRIWLGKKLYYDAASDDVNSIIASNQQQAAWKFYDGSDQQTPDPRWQADKGVNNVSGYPGEAYIVFYDLDLTDYGNSLAGVNMEVELVCAGSTGVQYDVAHLPTGSWGSTAGRDIVSVSFSSDVATAGVIVWDTWGGNPTACEFWEYTYGARNQQVGGYALSGYGYSNAPYMLFVCQSDRPIVMTCEGYNLPNRSRIRWHDYDGTYRDSGILDASTLPYQNYSAVVDGTDTFLWSGKVYKFSGSVLVATSAASYQGAKIGYSSSYLFLVYDSGYASPSSTTVYVLDRTTLALVATHVQSVSGTWAAIHVVDDDTFYTLSEDHVYRWESGVVVEDMGAMLSFSGKQSIPIWFNVLSDAPRYAFSLNTSGSGSRPIYVGHEYAIANVAKLHDIITSECALAGIDSSDLDLTELTNSDVRGYKIGAVGSVRAALEPLQAAFPFDILQSGYKIKFKSRGGASVITIPESDLGAHPSDEALPALLPESREMDDQIARTVTISYYDPNRAYDVSTKQAARPGTDSSADRNIDLPIVLTGDEALRMADVLLKKEWTERRKFNGFSLPPTYRALEPADVVTITYKGRSLQMRLTRIEYLADGRLTCDAALTDASSYSSTAAGQDPLVIAQQLVPYRGPSGLQLLDIPRLVSQQDVPGIVASVWGYTSTWPGAALYRSDDSGQSYNLAASFADKSEVFNAVNSIGAVSPYSVDVFSSLTVTPEWTGADLYSITESQLYAHQNIAAYGADGRWEIIAFKTVATSGANYVLRDFLRGLYGTEWAMSQHVAGDKLVMLDINSADFVGLPTTTIGSSRLWRSVTSGAVIETASDVSHTYSAVNLKPLSPVDVRGSIDQNSGDFTIEFDRRTRSSVELFSGSAVPLGESSESYQLEIWTAGFVSLLRTLSSSTKSFTYTNAQQIADTGAQVTTVYYKLYQLSSLVGKGFSASGSLTRVFGLDPYLGSVVSLVHMNGSNGSTTFTDECGYSAAASGNAQISTARYKWNGSSGLFDGSGDFITLDARSGFAFGTGDFTLEAWVYIAANSAADGNSQCAAQIFSIDNGATNSTVEFNIAGNGTTTGTGLMIWTAAKNASDTATATITQGAWHHVIMSRASGVLRFGLDGAKIGSDIAYNYQVGASNLTGKLGGRTWSGGNYTHYLNGNINDFRATKGVARLTGATYVVPPATFQNP